MANTLTPLIDVIFAALDKVSRERLGFVRAVTTNSGVERAAIGQTVTVPIAPEGSVADNTPGMTAPDTGDVTAANVNLTISKSKHYPIRMNGEETMALKNSGTYEAWMQGRFEQAFRKLSGLIETDLGSLYTKASRAVGTAGTAPFGTSGDLSDVAGLMRILEDNGAPDGELQLVLGSAAMANLRGKQSVLFKANEAGTDQLLRDGIVTRLEGFDVRSSRYVATHTIGTADADYDVDLLAGYAAGTTTIHLDTGTGTHVAGDVITFAGDPNNYVIRTGAAGNGDKDIVIGAPGLQFFLADGVSCDIADDSPTWQANMAFARSAVVLGTRFPAMPEGGDSAVDMMSVTDPISGLAFEIAHYKAFLQNVIHVRIAWGYELIKPEHAALLIG